jgi:hypothetical protein
MPFISAEPEFQLKIAAFCIKIRFGKSNILASSRKVFVPISLSGGSGGRAESAGINRHRVEGVSPLHERRSCSIMAPSHASAIREEAAKR